MNLIVRLASPVQTWAGYRVRHADVATNPIPTKSGVAGLLGACIGQRDYLSLLGEFTLRVRVDRTNAAEADLQVATPPHPGRDTQDWHRSASLQAACRAIATGQAPKSYRDTQINITGGTKRVQYSPNRTFIPHAEFICALGVDDGLGARLIEGFRHPTYTPYLGRMANPASFPFYFGAWRQVTDVMEVLPHVAGAGRGSPDSPRPLRVHAVTGAHTVHHSTVTVVTPPNVLDRNAQLQWVKENLDR